MAKAIRLLAALAVVATVAGCSGRLGFLFGDEETLSDAEIRQVIADTVVRVNDPAGERPRFFYFKRDGSFQQTAYAPGGTDVVVAGGGVWRVDGGRLCSTLTMKFAVPVAGEPERCWKVWRSGTRLVVNKPDYGKVLEDNPYPDVLR